MCLKVRSSLELNTARWLKLHPDDSGSADTRRSALNPPLPKPNEERGCFNQVKKNLDSDLKRRLKIICKEILDDLQRYQQVTYLSFASYNLM